MAPIEGRGAVAAWDHRLGQLTLYTSAQMPHINRTGLSECLGLDHGQVRVIAPDVGGGFGYKGILLAEEVCLGWLAIRLGHPVRWIEDRREHLTANANCREHHYIITAYADRNGSCAASTARQPSIPARIRRIPSRPVSRPRRSRASCPARTIFRPTDAGPGRRRRTSVDPSLSWSRAHRVCFALELVLDAIAREVGLEPAEVRARNLVRPEQNALR